MLSLISSITLVATMTSYKSQVHGHRSLFLNCRPSFSSVAPSARPVPLAKRAAADTVEKVTGLVILVDFPDQKASVSRKEIDDMINKPGYNGLYGTGSARDYWLTASHGKLEYGAVVTEYYTTLREKTHYDSTPLGTLEMFQEVLKGMEARGFDFSPFTRDPQGRLRALTFLYVGAFDLSDSTGRRGLEPVFIDEEAIPEEMAMTFDGVKLSSHMVSCIDCFPDKEKAFSKNISIHEMGHMLFHWPDLYGFDGKIEARGGLGHYCIMSMGLSTLPPPPNPYLRIMQGWETPVELSMTGTGVLSVPSNGRKVYRYSRPDTTGEFFLIEAVAKKGLWAGFPDDGLAIYHVLEQEDFYPEYPIVSIEQADGRMEIEKFINNGGPNDLFHAGNNAAFNSESIPDSKWWDETPSGLAIMNISAVKDTMTFQTGVATMLKAAPAPGIRQLRMIGRTMQLDIRAAGHMQITALAVDGRSYQLTDRPFEAGSHILSLASIPPGVYIVTVNGKDARRFSF